MGTPDCCCERVSQDLDLVAGSAGGAPVSIIGGRQEAGHGDRLSAGRRCRCAQEGRLGGGAAWATARTRTRPGARFRRLARRFGKGNEKKAAVAVARTLICIAWAVLSRGQDYAEAGEDYYEQRDRRDREHLIRHHQQALARLGYQVTLIPPGDGSAALAPRPPPARASPVSQVSSQDYRSQCKTGHGGLFGCSAVRGSR